MWATLLSIATFGIWSETTKIGSTLSGAIVSILVGFAASNLGIIPYEAPAYSVVMEYLLPMVIPLLLFKADLRLILQSTGTLFLAFLLGSGYFHFTISVFPFILIHLQSFSFNPLGIIWMPVSFCK
ncbi:uncharacterized protein LOC131235244 [Magnolia sinica]|uniref:uncharacterized protein LOC131235244 n=1 Tax=Magnolia sinica TaxID=86752 RepID=UPI00265B2663|nr:uncharacterized protein LOC131235244 [Magnolia sinica]